MHVCMYTVWFQVGRNFWLVNMKEYCYMYVCMYVCMYTFWFQVENFATFVKKVWSEINAVQLLCTDSN